jgi:signal transduction histidine kinase
MATHHESPSYRAARVKDDPLSRLLVIQQVLAATADDVRIAEFTQRALCQMAGVRDVRVCLGGRVSPPDPRFATACRCSEEALDDPAALNLDALLISIENARGIPIRTDSHFFGFIALFVDDDATLQGYLDFLGSIANEIGLVMHRRLMKKLLHASNAELEATNEELAQRNEELRRANDELRAFAHSVSHDLRSPLVQIEGMTELLVQHTGEGDETTNKYLAIIVKTVRRMRQLIEDLLRLSQTSQADLQKAPVHLGELVDEVIEESRRDAQDRDIEWRTLPLPGVIADRGLLRTALVNLVSNAVKYTAGRTPAHIEIGATRGKGEASVFYVRDDGAGFDMRRAHRLFVAFQRLHSADRFPGTGIGLATTRRIVERHGGHIWAEAEPERGATFFFTLGD